MNQPNSWFDRNLKIHHVNFKFFDLPWWFMMIPIMCLTVQMTVLMCLWALRLQDFLRRRIPGADTGELPNGADAYVLMPWEDLVWHIVHMVFIAPPSLKALEIKFLWIKVDSDCLNMFSCSSFTCPLLFLCFSSTFPLLSLYFPLRSLCFPSRSSNFCWLSFPFPLLSLKILLSLNVWETQAFQETLFRGRGKSLGII